MEPLIDAFNPTAIEGHDQRRLAWRSGAEGIAETYSFGSAFGTVSSLGVDCSFVISVDHRDSCATPGTCGNFSTTESVYVTASRVFSLDISIRSTGLRRGGYGAERSRAALSKQSSFAFFPGCCSNHTWPEPLARWKGLDYPAPKAFGCIFRSGREKCRLAPATPFAS